MPRISDNEKGIFLSLFNRNGYILDFSTSTFDVFTQRCIGLALCAYYKQSKGRALTTYANEAKENDVIKLFGALLEYYEMHYQSEINGNQNGEYFLFYKKCRSIMDRINTNTTPFTIAGESLKQKFSSEYMTAQIDIMLRMQNENPTEAIGKSKEFIESCCKTILEKDGQMLDKDWNVNRLVKETMKFLQISADNLKDDTAETKAVKTILGSLGAIAGSIAELRNAYGSGHGKSANYKGLSSRHAKLTVGSSITLVNYLWETYEWRKRK